MLFDYLIVNTGKVITPSIIALEFKKRSIPISHNTAVRFVGKMVETGMFNKIDRIYVRDLTYYRRNQSLAHNATFYYAGNEDDFNELYDEAAENLRIFKQVDTGSSKEKAVAMTKICNAFIKNGYKVFSGVVVLFTKDENRASIKSTYGIDFITERNGDRHYYVFEDKYDSKTLEYILLKTGDAFPKTIISLKGESRKLDIGIAIESVNDILAGLE